MVSVLDLMHRPHRGVVTWKKRLDPLERAARFIDFDVSGCWLWQGRLNNCGYGLMTMTQSGYETKSVLAHRAVYELHKGPVSPGLQIDHLCRVRRCVNPEHMEAVTASTNCRRRNAARAQVSA